MKTSQLLKIALIFLLEFASLSCKRELLSVKNENNYTADSYFKTSADFNEAIIGTYAVFSHQGMMSREWYFIFDLLANDAERAFPLIGTELQLADYSYTPNNDDINFLWSALYRMIFRANFSFKVMNTWTPKDSAEVKIKKQYIAEAHWLRGFAYFYLVANWGRVPVKMSFEASRITATPRSPVADVWQIVENEFLAAIPDLPVEYPTSQRGRATQGAAIAFLGKAYLFQKKYAQGSEQLKKLIKPPFTYVLDPDFDHLYSDDNINSPEVVFAVNHIFTTANTTYYMFGDQESANGRTFHTGRAQEYGFNDWENVTVSQALVKAFTYPNPINQVPYQDPRGKLTYYGNAANGGDTNYCDACTSGPILYSFEAYGNSYRKYEPYEKQKNTLAPMSGINTHVVRFADVLLMLAECYIEEGLNIPEAIGFINQVRDRPGINAVNYPINLDKVSARVILRRERRIEFAGEQSRWLDLLRWGEAKEVLNREHPAGAGQQPFLDKHMLLPIPTSEIESNSALAADIANEWN